MFMQFLGAQSFRVFLLPVMLIIAFCAQGVETTSDSIRLDGKILLIDAQVRFDSTDFKQQTGSGSNRPVVRRYKHSSFLVAHVGMAIPEVRESGSSLASWTRQSLPVLSIGAGTLWPGLTAKRTARGGVIESLWSLDRLNRTSLDLHALPDSVIGFVQNEETREIEGVVYERFPIGVETDTVPVVLVSTHAWRASIQIGWSATWKTHWSWHAAVGASALLMREESMGLRAPDLSQEQPYWLEERLAGELIPLLDLGVHRRLTSSSAYVASPWTIGMHARLQPGSRFWIGVQMRWHRGSKKTR
jgi:hypothetical protein